MSLTRLSRSLVVVTILTLPSLFGCRAASWLKTRAIEATAVDQVISYQDPKTGYLGAGPSFVGKQSSFEQPETGTQRALRLDEENRYLRIQIDERDEHIRSLSDQLLQRDTSFNQAKNELTSAREDLSSVRHQLNRWNGDLKTLYTNVKRMESENKETFGLLSRRLEQVIEEHAKPRDGIPDTSKHETSTDK